jgi:nucleoside-diphosphate-sugar epimerase
MAKVLVTGATGFIGGALASALRERGHEVVAMVGSADAALPEGVARWIAPRLPAVAPDAVEVLRGFDAVVHAAGRASKKLEETAVDPVAIFREANTVATLALAHAAVRAGVRRFVFLSSIAVNGSTSGASAFRADGTPQPDEPYAQSKWEAEQALDALVAGPTNSSGMTVHHVRPPLVYGRGARGNFALLVRLVGTGLPLPFGALRAPRSFVALDNLVEMLVCLVEHPSPPSGVLLVADAEATTTADFVRAIAGAMGRRVLLVPVPERLLGAVAGLVGGGEQVRKLAAPSAVDITATRERLGWQPPLTMEQALSKTFAGPRTGEAS